MSADFRSQLIALLPRVRRFALGLSRNTDEADDLVQAACERAISRSSQWQPGSRLDSWMFRIVQNLYYDRVRSQTRRRAVHEGLGVISAGAEDGEAMAHNRLSIESVRRAVAMLPPDQKITILLVCVEGYSYKETAEALGLPIGTVTSRLTRARVSLARMLGETARTAVKTGSMQIAGG
ncbi:MAG: RNA polymerase sigma factor [Rhodospirillales bacterium]|nr:RNA polymerase sigma factor [Rhodospirillales bacterium]